MNRAYNAWRENYPKVVEFFQLEAAEPILSYHKDISGIYAFCNEKVPKKKLHSQIVTQNGPVVTFNGPNYRGEGFFNGKHGTAKLIGGEPKETSRLDFYVDNENRLHGRISQPTKTDFRYIGFLESR